MPTVSPDFHELDRQQVLVNLDDLRDDGGHGEILFDQHFVQAQRFLDELLVVVPVVPDIKLAVEGISFLRVFLLLELEQVLAIPQTNGTKFLLQIVEELGGDITSQEGCPLS